MAESLAWQEVKYGEVFETELRGLFRRRNADPSLRLNDLEMSLKSLYIMDGADWIGRGELQDTIMAATIAAHEHFITEWRKEQDNGMERESYPRQGQEPW